MRQTYDKLVRDRIPEIINMSGKFCQTDILDEDDYRRALLAKLVEEAHEARDAAPDELISELADLLEVIDATIGAHGLSRESVENDQRVRRDERGGFERRVRLCWTE
jgi:predicted house-cleaning noncanonical NTP pyrophosphatase (MazG superfamily)